MRDAEALTSVKRERLLTAGAVGAKLAKTPRWVLAEARAGRIPHVRLGRSVRFRESSIDEWVRDLERGPAPGMGPGGLAHD